MKRALGLVGGALAFAVVAWAAACAEPPATADDGLPPVPAAIAARLPHYCRYDVDLSGVPNPHAEVLANTEWSDRTCPFAAGGAGPVRIYRPRGDQPCDASQLRGMKVAAVRDLDNRTGQREMRCVFEPSGGHGLPAALRGGGRPIC